MTTLKVLVVDDELGMRLAVKRALDATVFQMPEAEGPLAFETSLAQSGEEALAAIAASPPDLLLLDHKLPGISGIEALSRLSGTGHDFLTIMITAYATIETAVAATRGGAFDFLAKPFTPEELKATVYKASKHLILSRHARQLINERKRLRFELISIVAHELKAPLAAIEQFLGLVNDDLEDSGHDTSREMIARSILRIHGMRTLILDLLDLTRIESGQRKREIVRFDLVAAARAVLENHEPEAHRRNIALKILAPEVLDMRADRSEMELILNNLVSNAIKYNREGGRVELRLRCEMGRAVIEVEDTGIGLSEEETARLFGEFARIKNARTADIPGTGLGLSIVKKIADLYGGVVMARSREGEGSVFRADLPECSNE